VTLTVAKASLQKKQENPFHDTLSQSSAGGINAELLERIRKEEYQRVKKEMSLQQTTEAEDASMGRSGTEEDALLQDPVGGTTCELGLPQRSPEVNRSTEPPRRSDKPPPPPRKISAPGANPIFGKMTFSFLPNVYKQVAKLILHRRSVTLVKLILHRRSVILAQRISTRMPMEQFGLQSSKKDWNMWFVMIRSVIRLCFVH
jgi:hypothetical protein